MPLEIEDDLIKDGSRAEQIKQVLENSSDIVSGNADYETLGRKMLALLVASIEGRLTLKPDDRRDVRSIMSQLVPTAPKRVEMTHVIKPEEYIAEAMENNADSFTKLAQKAEEFELEAEEKRKQLEEYISLKGNNVETSDQETVIGTQEGDC